MLRVACLCSIRVFVVVLHLLKKQYSFSPLLLFDPLSFFDIEYAPQICNLVCSITGYTLVQFSPFTVPSLMYYSVDAIFWCCSIFILLVSVLITVVVSLQADLQDVLVCIACYCLKQHNAFCQQLFSYSFRFELYYYRSYCLL